MKRALRPVYEAAGKYRKSRFNEEEITEKLIAEGFSEELSAEAAELVMRERFKKKSSSFDVLDSLLSGSFVSSNPHDAKRRLYVGGGLILVAVAVMVFSDWALEGATVFIPIGALGSGIFLIIRAVADLDDED